MQVGLFLWCSVFIDDAGPDGPDPYSRHHRPDEFAALYRALIEWAKVADRTGYESFWLTEHHFQREGYEIVPNALMTCAILAQHTQRLKFGSMFHQVPTWHPLRLAEDFAIADIMSGGRLLFGTGRGSVEREAAVFGVGFGRGGDAGDRANRELFEEQMEIIKLAWSEPSFRYRGKFYQLPPEGVTDRGRSQGKAFDTLTLVPAPTHPVEIWQALGSEPTLHYAAQQWHKGVMPLFNRQVTKPKWERFGALMEQYQSRPVRSGEDRRLVTHVHLGRSREAAMARIRPGHDERMRFLAQQRPLFGYLAEDGTPFTFGRVPTLEESMKQGGWFVGSPDEVSEELLETAAEFGLEYLAVEVAFSGLSAKEVADQIDCFGQEVIPALQAAPAEASRSGPANSRPECGPGLRQSSKSTSPRA